MPFSILMPKLSPTMASGNLVKWLKNEGDRVQSGDVIVEIETDKAIMEFESADSGILGKIVIPAGTENVNINTIIGFLLESGETIQDLENIVAVPAPAPLPESAASPITSAASPMTVPAGVPPSPFSMPPVSDGERRPASPLARKLATEHGVNLGTLQGSGPGGRIIKSDVLSARAPHTAVSPRAFRTTGLPPFEALPVRSMRKVIAQRLSESKQSVPHFYLTIHAQVDKLLELRKAINMATNQKVTVNDFIVRACALALRDVPTANVSWKNDHIAAYQSSDISVAVAVDEGLITPIVRDAQLKTILEISIEMKDLIARARSGQLKPYEFQGGTMSLSNLGMFGVSAFSAIVNPPQGCILAVGAAEQRAIVHQDHVKVAQMMTCTLSVDHRAIDGAAGAQLLQALQGYLENPVRLIL